MTAESDTQTPRTDSRAEDLHVFLGCSTYAMRECVPADFARQLERDLAASAERERQQAERIAALEGALRRLFNLQPTQESSCNPTYWSAVQEARAALKEAEGE